MLESWPQPALVAPFWLTALVVMIPWLVWWHRRTLQHHSRRQLRLLLAVRIVIVLLLVLRLSGLRLDTRLHDVFVVFAADQSLSIDATAAAKAHQFIHEATQNVAPHSFAILPFSRRPAEFVSETDLHSAERWNTLRSQNSDWASATDLESAIVTASAAFPADKVARIVLLSDGNQTQGDLARAALAGGIPVWTVPLPASQAPEIMVSSIEVPNRVAPGETFHVDGVVDVRSSPDDQSVPVLAEVLGGDKVVFSEEKRLTAGENRIRVPLRLQESSLITLRVTPSKLTVADSLSSSAGESVRFPDTLSENNACSGYAFVRPGREVLLIDGQPETGGHLSQVLQAEGIPVVMGSLADLRPLPTGHDGPGMIILSGIPANQMTQQQMIWLRDYVGRRGGGFLMLGGDQSFGPGGYYRTVIEEILPVACDFDREQERPDLAMMLVIDKSGSMGGPKIELAKDAAKAAVELLSEHDQIGITTFDGSPYVVSPLSILSSPREVLDRISSIEVGGGTNLYPALQQARDALLPVSARLKHVVVLTDGYSKPGDYESLTRSMTAASITVSAVGVGDSDPELMQLIARVGQGRYYYAGDPAAVPQIFARETVLAGRAAVREEPFVPQVVRDTPVLADIDMVSAPPLLGHVMTRHRPSAEQILTTPAGDPLLTWWRFGLGMSSAFTSDAGGRWAADWVSWEHYSRFWSQVVRHCIQNSEPTGLATSVTDDGLLSTIKVIAVDRDDGFLNRAEIQIRVVDPDGRSATYQAGQTAPGEYQVQTEMRKPGAWQYHVTTAVGGIKRSESSHAHVVGYSDEFRPHEVNVDLLRTIALSTGGQYAPNATDVFQQFAGQFVVTSRSVDDYLTLAVLLLFVLDVALQRVRLRSRTANG